MGARAAAILAASAISMVATAAAAQPAQPAPDAPAAPPTPPTGMLPTYPPGAGPPSDAGGTPARPGGAASSPSGAPGGTGYAPPPGYGYPPGYGAGYPPGYGYPQPYYYYPPGANLSPPSTLPYEEGQTVPHGYRLESRPVRSLVIAGSVTFGSTYLVSILTASTVLADNPIDGKQLAPLFAPVVGPFIAVGTAHSNGAGTLLLVLDGLAQAGGATMLIVGLAAEEQYLQRTATARETPTALGVLAHPDVLVGPRSASLRWTF